MILCFRPWLRTHALTLILTAVLAAVLLSGCGPKTVIGEINDQSPVALIRFEAQEDGLAGVVYRHVNDFDALLAQSEVPVLVVFYAPSAPVNTRIIPRLEQMADDLKDQLQIVWINAKAETELSASFTAETLPQFTVVVEASLRRSLVGYGDEGADELDKLLSPYLPD